MRYTMSLIVPIAVWVFLVMSVVGYSQPGQQAKHYNIDKSGLALAGYDPVAYFVQGSAMEGSKEFKVQIQDVTYYFSTNANRETFIKNPTKYLPEYGGWCAYAMGASGEKVEIDPETFKIVDGKLYLFYNKYFNNTLKSWNKDEVKLKTQADKNWTTIIK